MIDESWARGEMDAKETAELLEILAARDEDEWQPEVFPIVEEVLRERGVDVQQALAGRHTSGPVLEIATGAAGATPEPVEVGPVVFAEFDDEVEAVLCRKELAHAGIEARMRRPDGSGAIELLVAEKNLEAARAVLEEAESAAGGEAESEFQCASCGFMADPLTDGDRRVCQVCGAAN